MNGNGLGRDECSLIASGVLLINEWLAITFVYKSSSVNDDGKSNASTNDTGIDETTNNRMHRVESPGMHV